MNLLDEVASSNSIPAEVVFKELVQKYSKAGVLLKGLCTREGLTQEEFLDFAPNHVRNMEELISRYNDLEPPPTFVSSTEVLKYSTELQLESQEHLISWVKTGNEDELFLANRTHQESFNMEMIGLGDFEKALAGNMP